MAQCVQCGRQLPAFSIRRKCQWCLQHEAAQRGEDVEYQRVEAAPWLRQQSGSMLVTQGIFGANVAVFLGMLLAMGTSVLDAPSGQGLVHWGANYGPATVSGEWWRLLTCVFVHGSFLHIAMNMWCLWSLGSLAESLYGHWTFAAVYLTTGISASLTSVALKPDVLSVGASGAIFGIAGALIASYYLGEFTMPRAAMTGPLRSVVIFAVVNIFIGFGRSGTDNAAHVGGLVMGLILGALIARVAPSQSDIPRRIAVLVLGIGLIAGGIFWLERSRAYLIHAETAVDLLSQGKTDEAIAELQKSLRQKPDFAPAHATLSRAYATKHDFDKAAAEMQRVIELAPKSEDAHYRLGLIYLEQKLPAKAQDVFVQMIKAHPNNADAHAALAEALTDQKKNQEALDEYKQVLALDADYTDVYYNIGAANARLGHYDDAIPPLLKQRNISDDPDNERLLAAVYQAKGMQAEAVDAMKKAEELGKKE